MLKYILVIFLTTFVHIQEVSHQNHHFEDKCYTLWSQTIVQSNKTCFLFTFLKLLMISQTTVKSIQVIIISLMYHSSSIVLWIFSYRLCIFDFWLICSHWSNQHSLILKLVLGFDRKLSVGHIETRFTYLLTPQIGEGRCEGAGWVLILVCFNLLICLI